MMEDLWIDKKTSSTTVESIQLLHCISECPTYFPIKWLCRVFYVNYYGQVGIDVSKSCIPEFYWEFFWAHAVHIYNRTPLQCHDWWTPYEKPNQQSPDIGHLHVFGCGVYVYLPADVYINKMAPKLELMVYLGIAPDNDKNYLFMHHSNNIKFVSLQMLFDEQLFSFVINLHAYILKLLLSRMMRLISISLHSIATMMTYHPLLYHLLIHLNHLIHTCLNVLLVPSHPPKGHARLLLSATHL